MPPTKPYPMLSYGSSGDAVVLLQKALNLAPTTLNRLEDDGSFGPLTHGRVVEFQGQRKAVRDGVVGPATWAELDSFVKEVLKLIDQNLGASPNEDVQRQRIVDVAAASLATWGWLSWRQSRQMDRSALPRRGDLVPRLPGGGHGREARRWPPFMRWRKLEGLLPRTVSPSRRKWRTSISRMPTIPTRRDKINADIWIMVRNLRDLLLSRGRPEDHLGAGPVAVGDTFHISDDRTRPCVRATSA